jgi:hypothetical protein
LPGRIVKKYLLDVSDCSECLMLSKPKFRRHWDRRSFTDLYYVRHTDLRSRSHPKIEGLTEEFFNGKKGELRYQTNMEFLLKELSPDVPDTQEITPSTDTLQTLIGSSQNEKLQMQ